MVLHMNSYSWEKSCDVLKEAKVLLMYEEMCGMVANEYWLKYVLYRMFFEAFITFD